MVKAMDPSEETRTRQRRLLDRARQGDGEAYGALFMEYHASLVRYAWPMLHTQEEAEDAVHDAFIKSWTRLDRFDVSRGEYGTWIFAITRNCCMDRLRVRKRRPTAQVDETVLETLASVRTHSDPERTALSRESRTEVRALVSELTEIYRETIVLHYWNEMSVREIAAITGTSPSNVKSRLSRGRTMLAKLYRARNARSYPDSAMTQEIDSPLHGILPLWG